MKTFLQLILFILILVPTSLFAQAPEAFNYQAVVRDNDGNILPNQEIGVELQILSGSNIGTLEFSETHVVTTSDFGLINLVVGTGTLAAGSFSAIQWGNFSHFLKVRMDLSGGTTYATIGTSQLLSVPYALHAGTESPVGPAGPPGATGMNGLNGPTGSTGATGIAGATGNQGANGMNGLNGATGPTGSIGETGSEGSVGPIGPTGETVSIGEIGLEGPQGATGPQGPTGATPLVPNIQHGKELVGPSGGTNELLLYTVVFPQSFESIPHVVCTASAEVATIYDDSFNVTTQTVTTTGFNMIINRVDNTWWGQNLEVHWIAIE